MCQAGAVQWAQLGWLDCPPPPLSPGVPPAPRASSEVQNIGTSLVGSPTMPCSAVASSISDRRTKIPHASEELKACMLCGMCHN